MDDQDRIPHDGVDGVRARRVLTDIAPRSWEHPADKAALAALRRLPVFDEVLRKLFGFFGEKPIRLAFQANAVKVSERQFPRVHALYREALHTLDVEQDYDLYVSQTPIVNAGAYGMDQPFIILNSGTLSLLDDDELRFIIGHELGHILSDHVLYRTMTVLLLQLAGMGFPIVGLAARAVLVALLEWGRKAELSCDRAGLLTVQDPEVAMRTMLKMAGGPDAEQMNLEEFIQQAEEYRDTGDVADDVAGAAIVQHFGKGWIAAPGRRIALLVFVHRVMFSGPSTERARTPMSAVGLPVSKSVTVPMMAPPWTWSLWYSPRLNGDSSGEVLI